MSTWRKDIQSLVKKCRILALYFFPKCRIGVGRGTEFTFTVARGLPLHCWVGPSADDGLPS
jgi:hypothetical protein